MASLNKHRSFADAFKTFEGAPAKRISRYAELRRAVLACFLWEDQFYESGQQIAERIEELAATVDLFDLSQLAIEARHVHHLRHVPLLLVACMAQRSKDSQVPRLVQHTLAQVIDRADEMTEFLAIYWRNGRTPVSSQVKKGLATAFSKFDAYQLAKYNRDGAIKLKDVVRIVHPKPANDAHAALIKSVIDGTLAAPDTWEVALSGGADKRETFERLLREGKLGYLALLRNLRNMEQAGVNRELVVNALMNQRGAERVLPFRYVAAAKAAPSFALAVDDALLDRIARTPPFDGETIMLVDVSGSMDQALSGKSDLRRLEAAAALAAVWPGRTRVFTFSDRVVEVPAYKGLAGMDAIAHSQVHSGTRLGYAVGQMEQCNPKRLVVITDEQSHDPVGHPVAECAYMVNVGSYKHGVGYGDGWTHIDGFSEGVIRYIRAIEAE